MKIIVELTDVDSELVDGFALATGWNESHNITKEDWLAQRVEAWARQQAVQGVVMGRTQAARETYVAAMKSAATQASQQYPVIKPKGP